MKIYLGETGLDKTWQETFPKTVKCHKCGKTARIMFVAFEDNEKKYISSLYNNMEDEKFWVHDACAIAVYLCEKCFEPNALINQA